MIMDEQQRQRLGIALKAKQINFREAVRATNAATGKNLNVGYVRELVRRAKGTKEILELICDANGISFDFVWHNRGGVHAAGSPPAPDAADDEYLTVSRGALKKAVIDACLWFGARLDDARAMAELVLTTLVGPKAHD